MKKKTLLTKQQKQTRGNKYILLSVNIKTNKTADKHRVEQTVYDNKEVGQIMSNTGQGTNRGKPHRLEELYLYPALLLMQIMFLIQVPIIYKYIYKYMFL